MALTVGLFELLNVIGVPLTAIYISKRNLYGENGLSSDIFFIGLFNIFTPLIRFVDPYYIYLNIRNWFYSRPSNFFMKYLFFLVQRLLKFKGQADYDKIYHDNYF